MSSEAIEQAHGIAISLRSALSELAANDERSAQQIRDRLIEIGQAVEGLCELLNQQIETPEESNGSETIS